MTATSPIQRNIMKIAERRFGAVDINVVCTNERVAGSASAPWYGLSVKLADGIWRFVGRRRLVHELVELVDTIDVGHLDGRSFQ